MLRLDFSTQRYLRVLLTFGCGLLIAFSAAADRGCQNAELFTLPGTWRGVLAEGGEAQWLRFEVLAPVVVVLDVTAPLTAPAEPLLTVGHCGLQKRPGGFTWIERSATRQVLFVHTPGAFFARVKTQDEDRPLGPYKVTATLADVVFFTRDIEEMEPEPESPLVCPIEDDHADTMACATPLAVPGTAVGEIGNAWGDDADVFRLELGEDQTVVIQSQGVTDTVGGLFNEQGQLLELDDDGGEGANFRLVKALVSGLYFVRVEGSQGAEGPYSLTAETLSW